MDTDGVQILEGRSHTCFDISITTFYTNIKICPQTSYPLTQLRYQTFKTIFSIGVGHTRVYNWTGSNIFKEHLLSTKYQVSTLFYIHLYLLSIGQYIYSAVVVTPFIVITFLMKHHSCKCLRVYSVCSPSPADDKHIEV